MTEQKEQTNTKSLVAAIAVILAALALAVSVIIPLTFSPDAPEDVGQDKVRIAIFMQNYHDSVALATRLNSLGIIEAEPWETCDMFNTAMMMNRRLIISDVYIVDEEAKKLGGWVCLLDILEHDPDARFLCSWINSESKFYRDCPGTLENRYTLMQRSGFADILP